jgi:hypothetical protein
MMRVVRAVYHFQGWRAFRKRCGRVLRKWRGFRPYVHCRVFPKKDHRKYATIDEKASRSQKLRRDPKLKTAKGSLF